MKFGETLYQRSVPKWATYNVDYNRIKRTIKDKTSAGTPIAVDIPVAGKSRWEETEKMLRKDVQHEYDRVCLFLHSKQGEIERRLQHLERQVKIAQRAIASQQGGRPTLQARKYQRLAHDSEEVGDEIQNLSRFASVQKTAFRKLLKKYRKWTGSGGLDTIVNHHVFSDDRLRTDFSEYLERLSQQTQIITEELAGPMLVGTSMNPTVDPFAAAHAAKASSIAQISAAALRGPLSLDAAITTIPFGEAAGSASYWIHPDNLEEARTVLLRHMRDIAGSNPPSRVPSRVPSTTALPDDLQPFANFAGVGTLTYAVYFDNSQRFIQDPTNTKPSKVALRASWNHDPDAVVTLAGLSPQTSDASILHLNREDLPTALQRDSAKVVTSLTELGAVQNYLKEHRDVRPLGQVCSNRSRYVGTNNTANVANWATLDSAVVVSPVDLATVGDPDAQTAVGEAFPYSILHIRWEFAQIPAVVRAFDESHLVERVPDFTLEGMAIHTVNSDLPEPHWKSLMQKDIRHVPLVPRKSRLGTRTRVRMTASETAGTSSGPSSTEGQSDSVFSRTRAQSSATSENTFMTDSPATALSSPENKGRSKMKKKKRARIIVPDPPPQRYWNEFDDGDSDVNQEETYAIYVDPNEPVFPGAETMTQFFSSMYGMVSWLSSGANKALLGERQPLLGGQADDEESSGSDSDEFPVPAPRLLPVQKTTPRQSRRASSRKYRPGQFLTARQRRLEQTYLQFYVGLITISFILLTMSSVLLATGRKKDVFEVDAGVLGGVVAAEVCVFSAVLLAFMRMQQLSIMHWGLIGLAVVTDVVVGVILLSLMFAGAGAVKKGPVELEPTDLRI